MGGDATSFAAVCRSEPDFPDRAIILPLSATIHAHIPGAGFFLSVFKVDIIETDVLALGGFVCFKGKFSERIRVRNDQQGAIAGLHIMVAAPTLPER